MISFKANYINSEIILKNDNVRHSPQKVAFVELNPDCLSDAECVEQVANSWIDFEKEHDFFGYTIYNGLIRNKSRLQRISGERFFALTSQLDDFHCLIPDKILGLAQVMESDKDTQYLEYLQVNPRNTKGALHPEFRHIGTAMLNSLKKVFVDKNITLDSVRYATNFYLKNGFKELGSNIDNEVRMLFERSGKTLH